MTSAPLPTGRSHSVGRLALIIGTTAVVFGVLDFIWLVYLARDLYLSVLGPIMQPTPRLAAAASFYLVYVAGLVYFAILPGLPGGVRRVAMLGGLLGGFAYAVYDLTNLSTLTAFTWKLAIIDIGWGALASAITAAAAAAVARAA